MKKEYEVLFGEMIGLARATDGNEHLINPAATAVLRLCLTEMGKGTADAALLRQMVEDEKRKMVPNCFTCANPCGRTFPFDLAELPAGEIRDLKFAILDALCRSPAVEEGLLYRCLVVIGLGDYEKEDLLPLLHQIG